MNKKVIIVWIIAVVIFAGIGLFGKANQHLLDEKEPSPAPVNPNNTPNNSTRSVACVATLPNGNSTYNFTIDNATNNINSVVITYQSTTPVETVHASAVNLSNSSINGITTNLSGSLESFTLIINANLLSYDATALANYQGDLANLFAVIGNYGNYDSYVATINSAVSSQGVAYNCS